MKDFNWNEFKASKKGVRPKELIRNILTIDFYNNVGLTKTLLKLINTDYERIIFQDIVLETTTDRDNLEKHILFMLLVLSYGEYGLSPRSGWIYNSETFKEDLLVGIADWFAIDLEDNTIKGTNPFLDDYIEEL